MDTDDMVMRVDECIFSIPGPHLFSARRRRGHLAVLVLLVVSCHGLTQGGPLLPLLLSSLASSFKFSNHLTVAESPLSSSSISLTGGGDVCQCEHS